MLATPAIKLVESKNKHIVPLINGSPMHSLHDPYREAEVFASNHYGQISKNHNILILGLGYGYHIEEIAKILKLKHKKFKIVALEARSELVKLCSSYRELPNELSIYSSSTADELYHEEELCRFLLDKPAVIIHQPSFNADKNFYSNFLNKRAANTINFSEYGENKWMKAYWEVKHAE